MTRIFQIISILSILILSQTPAFCQKEKEQTDELVSSEDFLKDLEEDSKDSDYVYNPKGKKDPFRSFDFSPKQDGKKSEKISPLEDFSYDELKITAILKGFDKPRAVIEDPEGKGHTIEEGSKIGQLGGTVIKIDDTKISILETVVEYTGEKTTRTVEMYLR